MGARWDQVPREAIRTRLSMAAILARLSQNARTFENWYSKRASCSYRYRVTCVADHQAAVGGPEIRQPRPNHGDFGRTGGRSWELIQLR